MDNKQLVERYPWLIPRNAFTGEIVQDYDYSWTELDGLPKGWVDAFGELMCEDIQEDLEKHDFVDKYRIVEVKEKFGSVRIYDDGVPKDSQIHEIIENYSACSEYICIGCGELDVPSTGGWIVPVCKKCIKKMNIKDPDKYWEEISKRQFPHTLPLTRRYRRWSSDKNDWEEFIVDLTPTVQKIRKRYAERKGN